MILSRTPGPWVVPDTQIIFYALCDTNNALTITIKWHLFLCLYISVCENRRVTQAGGGAGQIFPLIDIVWRLKITTQ
jgi:hypothetical protein